MLKLQYFLIGLTHYPLLQFLFAYYLPGCCTILAQRQAHMKPKFKLPISVEVITQTFLQILQLIMESFLLDYLFI